MIVIKIIIITLPSIAITAILSKLINFKFKIITKIIK